MYNSLFLLCPTDGLEPVINKVFKSENYFYTSLGNSFNTDVKTLKSIKELIKKYDIHSIYFILSSSNTIISDALGGQLFSEVKGLRAFYREINKKRKHSEIMWLADNPQHLTLSYFLNEKIKELQLKLGDSLNCSIEIKGKIYNRSEKRFKDIYSSLTCVNKQYLN